MLSVCSKMGKSQLNCLDNLKLCKYTTIFPCFDMSIQCFLVHQTFSNILSRMSLKYLNNMEVLNSFLSGFVLYNLPSLRLKLFAASVLHLYVYTHCLSPVCCSLVEKHLHSNNRMPKVTLFT